MKQTAFLFLLVTGIASIPLSDVTASKKAAPAIEYVRNGTTGKILVHRGSAISGVFLYFDRACESADIPPQLAAICAMLEKQLSSAVDESERRSAYGFPSPRQPSATRDSAGPLIATKWHQTWPYNSLCPEDQAADSQYNARVPAGCMAVALAQILNYHRYPPRGSGTLTYSDSYGNHTADFGVTQYLWNDMPESLSVSSEKEKIRTVAMLLSHCGIALKTVYGPKQSGAAFGNVRNALLTHFNYSPSLLHRDRYPFETLEQWKNALKAEIAVKRPICFSAEGTIGHGFVIDGYKYIDGVLYFHVNWGWGGRYDGYFNIDYLTVGSYVLTSGHQSFIRIAPPSLTPPANIRLILNPYPPVLTWDPVPRAKGYCFEYRMNQTMSTGTIEKGPDSATVDIRVLYTTPLHDTLKFKVCAIDSGDCYSSWTYCNIVNEGSYLITGVRDQACNRRHPDIPFMIADRYRGVTVSLPDRIMDAGTPTITLFSILGKKIASVTAERGADCVLPAAGNVPIPRGLYVVSVEIGGRAVFRTKITLTD